MNKKISNFLKISLLVMVLLFGTFNTARATDSVPVASLSSNKSITAFTIPSEVGSTTIDETNHTISITMPSGTDLSTLTPSITLSEKATISPDSGIKEDFTNPQTYTVTAEDKTTQIYTVTVADQQAPSGGGGGTPATLNVTTSVDVPTSCSATDTDGVIHNYPENSSVVSYLAVCALEAAIKNGSVSNVQLSNKYPSMGLFITSINGVTADSNSQYWSIYQNGNYASSGITLMPVVAGDTIMFQLHDFSDKNLGSQLTIAINSLLTNNSSGSGIISSGGYSTASAPISTITIKPTFDLKKAFDFLTAQQKDDGSFGESLYTDWSAIALSQGDNQTQILKSIKYFGENKIESSNLTDYERHAMALMTLGLNPYNTNGENYINKIVTSFDGKQFGDINQDNDDIFALIVLQNAGYTQNDKIITDDVNFILSKQNNDGSWDSSVDMTGATMEALSLFNQNEQVKNALTRAENFLKQAQKDDGGWGDNASSTAWVMEGILAQGEKVEDWKTTSGNTPLDYLATLQDTDGGIKDENLQTKIWETSYVISALSGKTWNQTMQKFEKEDLPKIEIVKKKTLVAEAPKKITAPTTTINIASQNTASVINAVTPPPVTTQTETPKKSWFKRLMDKIFGFF